MFDSETRRKKIILMEEILKRTKICAVNPTAVTATPHPTVGLIMTITVIDQTLVTDYQTCH